MRILIHAPNWVGDHIMAFPFYYAVKKIFNTADVFLVGRKWISSLVPDQFFHKIITVPNHWQKKDLIELQSYFFDIAFTLSPSFRSTYLLKQLKVPIRIGYKTDFRTPLLKYPKQTGNLRIPKINKYEHRSLSFIRLLTPYFESNQIAENYWMSSFSENWDFSLSEENKTNIENIKKEYSMKNKNYWLIAPGSMGESKIYPMEHLAFIINKLYKNNFSHKIVLIGAKIEKEYSQKLMPLIKKEFHKYIVNLTEKTDLKELIFFSKDAVGIIANDSGIAHLSYLTNTFLITFLGMSRKEETLTLNNNKEVFNLNLACSPCMSRKCKNRKNYLSCLKNIHPNDVYNSIIKMS